MFSPGRQPLIDFLCCHTGLRGTPSGRKKGGLQKSKQKLRRPPFFLPYGLSPQTPFPLSPLFPPAPLFPEHKEEKKRFCIHAINTRLGFLLLLSGTRIEEHRTCRCGAHGIGNTNAPFMDCVVPLGLRLRPLPPGALNSGSAA